MKSKIILTSFSIFLICTSCKKDNSLENIAPTLEVVTSDVLNITIEGADCGGTFSVADTSFIIEYGICWNKSGNPTVADNRTIEKISTEDFIHKITGLEKNGVYYVRAYGSGNNGISYGEVKMFTTLDITEDQIVTDYDGNIYHTVQIGDQCWMIENLKVTHYRNGDIISNISNLEEWQNLNSGGRCYYNDDSVKHASVYGPLYNYYVISDSRNICPEGWHIPTNEEWIELINNLGIEDSGGKMKEKGYSHWLPPNKGADNISYFSALPGGKRNAFGRYEEIQEAACWWTSTEWYTESAYYMNLKYSFESSSPALIFNKTSGMSLRCIKD